MLAGSERDAIEHGERPLAFGDEPGAGGRVDLVVVRLHGSQSDPSVAATGVDGLPSSEHLRVRGECVMAVIDVDQHLVEPRGMWAEHADPADRDTVITMVDDAVGNVWLAWRGQRLGLVEVQTPGETDAIGERHRRASAGEAPVARYDGALPRDHCDPEARLDRLDTMGVDTAVLFPNYGLLWERRLTPDRRALLANMRAWNRWCATVAAALTAPRTGGPPQPRATWTGSTPSSRRSRPPA